MILAVGLDLSVLFILIILDSLQDLSVEVLNKLSVHVLQLVVSGVGGDVCELDIL